MSVSRETRLSSRKASAIKGAASRKRVADARYARLERAAIELSLAARLGEVLLGRKISDKDRLRLRAHLTRGLKHIHEVLPDAAKINPEEPW